jgi:hypothetical protein
VASDNKGIAKRLIGFVAAAQQQGHGGTFEEIVAECVAALADNERDELDFAIGKLRPVPHRSASHLTLLTGERRKGGPLLRLDVLSMFFTYDHARWVVNPSRIGL